MSLLNGFGGLYPGAPEADPVGTTVFRDVTLIALAGFLVIVLLLLPWLNPVGRQNETSLTPPGSVIVEMLWPKEMASDVDLWVQAPGEDPVGYRNMGEHYFNLLRDDRGQVDDATPINYETAYSRGIPSGEEVVNVYLYRLERGEAPIPVTVYVSVVTPKEHHRRNLLTRSVLLEHEGQEITIARFDLDLEGVLRGSIHTLARSLVNPEKPSGYRRPHGKGSG